MDAAAGATATAAPRRPVVLYASPGMGHLVAMIELGKALGARGLAVTIVVVDPPYNTGATGPFLAGVTAANPSISFHRLPRVDRLQEALTFEVIRVSNPSLREFLAAASPAVLVVDFFCSVALGVARELGVSAYFFFTSGAEVLAFFLHLPVLHARTSASCRDMGQELVHVPGIPPFPATHAILPIMERGDAAYDGFLTVCTDLCRSQGIIVNTFQSLEPRVVDTVVAGRCTPPGLPTPAVYCIGPLIKSQEVAMGRRGVPGVAGRAAPGQRGVPLLRQHRPVQRGADQGDGGRAGGERAAVPVGGPGPAQRRPGEEVRQAAGAGPRRAPTGGLPAPDRGQGPRRQVVGAAARRAGARVRGRVRDALRVELGTGGCDGGRADGGVAAVRGAAAGRGGGRVRQRQGRRGRRGGGGQGAVAHGLRRPEGGPGAHAGGHAAGQGHAARGRRVGGDAGRPGGRLEDRLTWETD